MVTSCDARQSAADDGTMQWRLPQKLREISGLALTADHRLLAVADEEAIVYELDIAEGRLVKAFALGDPTVRGDFEGIAVLDDTVWLMTSDGDLYASTEGADGERSAFRKHEFGFKDDCELEGLAADAQTETLIMVCKDARKKKDRLVFEWSPGGIARKARLPEEEMADSIGTRRVHPSGVVVNPQNGDLIIVAAREKGVFVITREGEFKGTIMRLDPDLHSQAEGVALLPDGTLLIADEAVNGPATLTKYDKTAINAEQD